MKDINFNDIWDSLIVKCINKFYEEFSEEDITTFDIKRKDIKWLKKNLLSEYNKTRKSLKQKYYYKGDSLTSKIDNHKISACFCKSLINQKAFTFKMKKEIPDKLFFINYKLAYIVSLGVIYITLIDYYVDLGETQIVNKLIEQGTILVPNTTEGHDNYNLGRIKTLALNDIYGNEFDILTYSDMVFWIEYYNKKLMEEKLSIKHQ